MSESVEAKITAAQLRWAGHVHRMPEHRIPQQILYDELCEGERKRGRQKCRYKDTLKQNLKKGNIDPDTWKNRQMTYPNGELLSTNQRVLLKKNTCSVP